MTNVSCTGGGTVTPNYAAGTFTLDAAATAAGNTLACTVTNSARTDLSITKTDGAAQYAPGQTLTYTIVVSNAGPSAANTAVFTDPAISNLTVSSVTCGAATGSAVCPAIGVAAGQMSVANMQGAGIQIPTFPASSSVTFTVTGTVKAGASGSLDNTANIAVPSGSGLTDSNTANNVATDSDTLISPDVSVTKTGPAYAKPASPLAYVLTVKNETTVSAAGVVVTDSLPSGTTFVSADNGGVYNSGTGKVTWTVGALAASASQTLLVTLTAPDVAAVTAGNITLSNTASVVATVDSNSGNNASTVITQMVLSELIKRVRNVTADNRDNAGTARFATSSSGKPGEVLEYCLTYRNLGGVQLSNYSIADTVPATVNVLTSVAAYSNKAIQLIRGATGTAGSAAVTGGTTTNLTAAVDSDQGSLSSSQLNITLNTPVPVSKSGQACFQATIR